MRRRSVRMARRSVFGGKGNFGRVVLIVTNSTGEISMTVFIQGKSFQKESDAKGTNKSMRLRMDAL